MNRYPIRLVNVCLLIVPLSWFVIPLSGCGRAPGQPKPDAVIRRPQDQLNFDTLYQENCAACHGTDGRNGAAMDLANPEYQAFVDDPSLRKWISRGMPGTQMPAFAVSAGGTLTDKQVDAIVRGMRTRWVSGASGGGRDLPPYMQGQNGNPMSGRQDYELYCASCHRGSRQQVTSPTYLALVSDQALRSIIVAGRPDIGHPDWRNLQPGHPLDSEAVTDMVAYLASLRVPAPGQPYPQNQ